ncbi:MAG: hypothetical protein AAGF24_04715 [Cyanobacteria bacterium P01_H01_bin.121]
MTNIPQNVQRTLDALRQVAKETIARKQRLGHYYVVWRNGSPMAIGDDAPEHLKETSRIGLL